MNSSRELVASDEELVRLVLTGELHLFEQLMRRNNQRIYRAARAILKDDREAEDVMQDSYVRAYTHLADFDGRAKFATWLTRITVHEALGRLRRAKRLSPLEDALPTMTSSITPEHEASDTEMRALLERAIDELPDDFRAVFVLRAVEELSGVETAEVLGIPEDTVKTRLHRARGRLQASLLEKLGPQLGGVMTFEAPRCDRVVAEVMRRLTAR